MRHPRDPAAGHLAAECFGRLLATGRLDAAEASDTLRAAALAATGVDRSGLQARLMHALADSFDQWTMRRGQANARVRRAVAPLLGAWAPGGVVLRAAADAAGNDLEPGEASTIAAGMAAAVLRRGA
jgi:hypothetical protein